MPTPYARAKVTAVSGAAASLDLSGKAKDMILSSTTDCWINFNDTAVANTGFYLPADTPVKVDVDSKESISVIQDSAGGFLSALELGSVRLITTVRAFFKSDASLLKVAATSFGGNSMINTLHSATATGDSSILKEINATATGDSNLLATTSAIVTGDCTLVTP